MVIDPGTEPCAVHETAAWYRWRDRKIALNVSLLMKVPLICDACRERLAGIAAQYQPKEGP